MIFYENGDARGYLRHKPFLGGTMDFSGSTFPLLGFFCSADGTAPEIGIPLQHILPSQYRSLSDFCRDPQILTPNDAPSSGLLHIVEGHCLYPFRYVRHTLQNSSLLFMLESLERKHLDLLCSSLGHSVISCAHSIHSYEIALIEDHADQLDDTAVGYIGKISEQAKKIRMLIDSLKVYSQISLPTITDEISEFSTKELIQEIIAQLGFPEFFSITAENLPNIVSYRQSVELIFREILKNARQFLNKAESILTVSATQTDYSSWVHFSDNGPGFYSSSASKAFEPYRKFLDADGNVGMGLTIAQRKAFTIGATIHLGFKDGLTVFSVEFPRWI
jgi:light-regulated signal transduction histidine kinase (bacteriophytochrome)